MSEAHARMHLRENVRGDDVDLAIKTMLEVFVHSYIYTYINANLTAISVNFSMIYH